MTVPSCGRKRQQLHELILPLLQKWLRCEHENRTTVRIIERHEQRGHRQLNRLAQSHLIGEDQTRTSQAMSLECEPREILLVRPEPLVMPIHRRLDSRGGRSCYWIGNRRELCRLDDLSADNALDVLRD